MDHLEIYIPVAAEVKSISPWSLPKSVRRQMGLLVSDSEGRRKLTHSPEAIWICPVVLQRKGHKPVCHTGNSAMENMSSLLGKEFRAQPGPLQMSFVSANHTAYMVLKDTMPGKNVSAQTSLLPQGSAPRESEAAVIIYNEQVYLSITKHKQGRRKRQAPASQSSIPRSLKKERRNDNRPKQKYTTCKVSHSDTVTHKGGDAHLQHTDPVHKADSHFHKDAGGEQATEEAAGTEPAWFHPPEKQGAQIQVLSDEEADYIQINSGEADNIVGIVEQTRVGAACVSTSLRGEVDFGELEQEEEIARMKAMLRKKEAAVKNLSSS